MPININVLKCKAFADEKEYIKSLKVGGSCSSNELIESKNKAKVYYKLLMLGCSISKRKQLEIIGYYNSIVFNDSLCEDDTNIECHTIQKITEPVVEEYIEENKNCLNSCLTVTDVSN